MIEEETEKKKKNGGDEGQKMEGGERANREREICLHT